MSAESGDRTCDQCGGTGVYVGRSEVGGAAVVCHACDGGGTSTFPDNPPFKGPKILDGVKIGLHPHRPG